MGLYRKTPGEMKLMQAAAALLLGAASCGAVAAVLPSLPAAGGSPGGTHRAAFTRAARMASAWVSRGFPMFPPLCPSQTIRGFAFVCLSIAGSREPV